MASQRTLGQRRTSGALRTRPEQPIPEVLTELIDIVLKNNEFEFNNNYYLQIQGTAMGTKMAPAYAIPIYGKIRRTIDRTW